MNSFYQNINGDENGSLEKKETRSGVLKKIKGILLGGFQLGSHPKGSDPLDGRQGREPWQKPKTVLMRLNIFFLENLYRIHIHIRYLHDKVYERGGVYKRYSDSQVSKQVHKAGVYAFVISFVVFQAVQNLWPYMFTLKPRPVQAGQSSVEWTSYNDFNVGTPKTQVTVNGSGTPDDVNAGSLQIALNSNAVNPDFGNGADGDATISGTVNIKNLYEDDDVIGITTSRGVDKGLNKGAGTYSPSSGAVPNFNNLTITSTGILTTDGPSGASPGVKLEFKASGTLTIDTGGKIDANGKGYAGGATRCDGQDPDGNGNPGYGSGSGGGGRMYAGGGGGGYGNAGGNGANSFYGNGGSGGVSYGAFPTEPAFGSGGGSGGAYNSGNCSYYGGPGGAGGGLIKIQASNLSVNGQITANGSVGGSSPFRGFGGGGSGGGIYVISSNSFNATNITANGGNGGGQAETQNGGGGGAGGRTVIQSLISGAPSVSKGIKGIGYWSAPAIDGGDGEFVNVTPYYQNGTLGGSGASDVGLRKDVGTGVKAKWGSVAFGSPTLTANQAIKLAVRTSDDGTTWSALKGRDGNNIDWTTGTGNYLGQAYGESVYSTITGISPTRYIDIVVRLESLGGDTPTLNDVTLTYNILDTPTALKQFRNDNPTSEINSANSNNYTNESTVNLKATVNGFDNPSTLTPEFEVRTSDSGWTGSPATPSGVTATPSNVNYSGSPVNDAAVGNLSGLSAGSNYYWKVRLSDGAGRVSGWSSVQSFSVEQTPPTGSITGFKTKTDTSISLINGKYYSKSTDIRIDVSANDAGGSNLRSLQLSNDGVTWGTASRDPGPDTILGTEDDIYTFYSGQEFWIGSTPLTTTINWKLSSGDSEKTVYMRVKDNAGNVGAIAGGPWIQTTNAEFNTGTKTDVTVANDSVKLGPVSPNWIDGLASTPLEGKQVYNADVSGNKQWKTSQTSCVGPQCATGLDPDYPSNYSLVADNTVDFSLYPARDACKAMDGRLSTMQELLSISANQASYGNNFQSGDYWSSTELISSHAMGVWLGVGSNSYYKTNSNYVRCVRTSAPEYLSSGNLTSSAITPSSGMISWGTLNYTKSDASNGGPAGTAITADVLDGNGSPIAGYTNLSSGASLSGLSVSTYPTIKLKANLSTSISTNTPTLADWQVGHNIPATDTITLDMASPTAFDLSSPANNTWQNTTALPTLSWNVSTDANNLSKYELWTDGALKKTIVNGTVGATANILNQTTGTVSYTLQTGEELSQQNHPWYIKAIDNAGNITQSTSTWNIGYDATNPSLALDPGFTLSATDTNNTTVLVNWNIYADDSGNGAPADYYNIERLKYSDYLLGSHTLTSNWALGGDGAGSGYYGGYGNKTTTSQTDNVGANPADIEASVKYIYRIKVTDKASNVSTWLRSDTGLTADIQKPTDPSNVTATACDGTAPNCSNIANKGYEIKLSWTASVDTGTGITGYKIYRRAEANSTTPSDFTLAGYLDVDPPGSPVSTVWYDNDANNDATFTDTINEVPNTSIKPQSSARLNDYVDYYYRISAIDSTGNQTEIVTLDAAPPYLPNQNNFATAKTKDVTVPSVPADLIATPMGIDDLGGDPATQQMDISWTVSTDTRTSGRIPSGNGSGVKEYKLYFAAGDINGPTESYQLVQTTSQAAYSHKGLGEFTYYYYKIQATDNSLNASAQSTASSARTASSQIPTTPSSVTVTSLKGDPNTDANVGKRMTITFNGSKIKYATNTLTGYQVYRSTTNYSLAGDWLDPTKATLVKTFSGLNVAGDTQDGQRSFSEDVPTDAATYYYKVRAVGNNPDLGGVVNSGLSTISPGTLNTGWDTTPDATEPTTPQEVKVKDIHGDGSTMLRNIITWQRIPDSDSQNKRGGSGDFKEYRVYRYTDTVAKSDLTFITKTTLGDNYYVDGITSDYNKLYYYYVVAVDNAAGEYKYSNGTVINGYSNVSNYLDPVSINPAAAKPTVLNPQAINIGVSSATITWTTDQNADSLVEYREKNSNNVIAGGKDRTAPTTSHSVDIKALNKGTVYEYRIVSRNSLGNIDEIAANTWKEFTTQDFAITNTDVITTTTTATVKWNTNIDSDSQVEYKKEARVGEAAEESKTAGDPKVTKGHEVVIKALRPDTNYTYKIRSVTNDKFISETQFLTFKTKPYDASQFVISPNASSIAEQNITATSAKITWNTAVATTSWLDYGTSSGNYTMAAGNDNYSTVHVVELVNLTPGNTYYYKVRGKDTNDIEYTSQEYSFTAVLLPKISNAKVIDLGHYSLTVSFDTNVDVSSFVAYGKDTSYGAGVGKTEFSRNHSTKIENLEDNTTYHYQVSVKDKLGNEEKTADLTFTTPLDTAGPEIKEVKIDILPMGNDDETASAIISWTTNKQATTKIEYDEGVIGGTYSKKTTEDPTLNSSHTVIIKELNSSSTYHFKIVSRDKRGNSTNSQDYTFVTPTKEKSILQLILRSLEETFSWVKELPKFFRGIGKRITGR